MARLLIVEDHADIAEGLHAAFTMAGHRAEVARDGRLAIYAARATPPDLVILDLGLPHVDGYGVLARLRSEGLTCPVLILSARGAEGDKVEGFRLGADDYVTKPFGMRELLARVAAQLRRAATQAPPTPSPAPPAGITDEALRRRHGLTPRQIVVARLVAEGLTNEQIGTRLDVTRLTARNHVDEVMRKLDAATRARVGAILRGAPSDATERTGRGAR